MSTPDQGKQVAQRIPSQDERSELRTRAASALVMWNAKPAYYKAQSDMPPLVTVPCEVLIGLLDEHARLIEVEARMKGLEK
jgi:hypothetical protein